MKAKSVYVMCLLMITTLQGKVFSNTVSAHVLVLELQEPKVYTVVEIEPTYPGGADAMGEFIRDNLKYPPAARTKNVHGWVFVQFTVTSDGKITDIASLKGIGEGCDEEAKRVVSLFPKWNPGQNKGKAVHTRIVVPIDFQL
jgi:protein TonB